MLNNPSDLFEQKHTAQRIERAGLGAFAADDEGQVDDQDSASALPGPRS